MGNYNSLKATINANVKQNGNREITGVVMNSVLNAMVNSLGTGYQYVGIATPSTDPGTPDARVAYIASEPGTYTHFGGIVVNPGEVCFLKWDISWSKDVTGAATRSIAATNPVGAWCPDPCVWDGQDGYFYIKGTGSAAFVKRTQDFVHYEDTGRTFISPEAKQWCIDTYADSEYPNTPHFWAPQVVKIGGQWILYLAVVQRGGINTGRSAIVAFTSNTPTGDFANPVQILISDEVGTSAADSQFKNLSSTGTITNLPYAFQEAIDPFVYCDPDDGNVYLLCGSSWGVRRFNLSPDGLHLKDNVCMYVGGQRANATGNEDRHNTFEAAYLYSKVFNGKTYYYMFVSSGWYDRINYTIKCGACPVASGQSYPGRYDTFWMPTPNTAPATSGSLRSPNNSIHVVLQTDPNNIGAGKIVVNADGVPTTNPNHLFWSPGHIGGILESKGKTYILYHCHDAVGTNDRKIFIQELKWDANYMPYVEGGYPAKEISVDTTIAAHTEEIANPELQPLILHGSVGSGEFIPEWYPDDIVEQFKRGRRIVCEYDDNYDSVVILGDSGLVTANGYYVNTQ